MERVYIKGIERVVDWRIVAVRYSAKTEISAFISGVIAMFLDTANNDLSNWCYGGERLARTSCC